MKRLAILLVLLLAGCAANLGFQFGNSGKSATSPSVGPGGSFSSGGANGRFSDGTGSGSLFGVGVLGVLFGRDQRGTEARTPPELDTTRRVNEQDCTKPVDNPANLRCN
jgi:hypothetical protein